MVSLKNVFKRYKYLFLLVSLFVLGGASQSFAVIGDATLKWVCLIGETKCCVNGAKSCCEDNGTLYDTWSCDDSSCGASGTKQYKYTADSDCGYTTSTRTCCSNGSWSGWDAACPAAPKQCSTASKPESKTTCYGGYKRRTVSCNTSTGTWTTGSWGDCDCSDSEFESVTTLSGGTCCQRKDGTGLLCAAGQETIGHRWESFGTSYGCTGGCPAGTPVDGAPCPDYWAGSFCTTHHSWSERGEEICNQFYCR